MSEGTKLIVVPIEAEEEIAIIAMATRRILGLEVQVLIGLENGVEEVIQVAE